MLRVRVIDSGQRNPLWTLARVPERTLVTAGRNYAAGDYAELYGGPESKMADSVAMNPAESKITS